MKKWVIQKHGSVEGLALEESETPQPGAGEALVKVHAVSLNYRDLLTVQSERPGNLPPPFVPCSDGAGEVVACGEGCTRVAVGERVAGSFFRDWQDGPFEMRYHGAALGGSAPGMLAEYVVLPEHALVRLPDHLSYAEGASLPCAGVTAWQALFTRGGLQAGESVLVLGTGGVSVIALQLAKAAGAEVIATSSSDEKLARTRELGARHLINYKTTPDWDKEVWRLTEKRGVDHVVEVGGPGTLEKSMNAVRGGGQVALIGVLTGFGAPPPLFPLMTRNARLDGIYVGSRADFEALNAFLDEHQLAPVIGDEFPAAEARAAFTRMERGEHFGKIVLRW